MIGIPFYNLYAQGGEDFPICFVSTMLDMGVLK
jgi:hypothetical protein